MMRRIEIVKLPLLAGASLIFIVLLFFQTPTVLAGGAVQLPRTGQTKCFDSAGTEVACAGTGQDGEIQAGAKWPSPRFSPGNGDESNCIIDNLTGLMWPKDASLGGTITWNEAVDYANNLILCGHDDWRLPNVNELESLFNHNEPNRDWLHAQGFTNVGGRCWSSTTVSSSTDGAWIMNMGAGDIGYNDRSGTNCTWPVRAGQSGTSGNPTIMQTGQVISYRAGDDGDLKQGVAWPSPRFTDNNNGAVTDNLTGLIWTKDANAPGPSACSPATTKNWQEALDYVNCLNAQNYLGHSDWRLPNREELRSLTDYSQFDTSTYGYGISLPAGHPFTGVAYEGYWSSNTLPESAGSAWYISMSSGSVSYYQKNYPYSVWPLRAGTITNINYGLVAYYPFNGNTNDVSGKGNNGTVNGATQANDRFDNANSAYSLDGTDDFINISAASSLDFGTGDFTIALWVNFASTQGEQILAEKYIETESAPTRTGWSLTKLAGNGLVFGSKARIIETAPLSIETNSWIQAVVSREGTKFSLYWNGQSTGSGESDTNLDSTSSLKIGHRGNPTDTPGSVDTRGFYLNGFVDDVRIYNRALSAVEIQALYNEGGWTGNPVKQALTVTKSGNGTGTVTSSPAGINCGSTCTSSYTTNTGVTLTALADSGATFAGWSGACSGTGSCSVTMDASKNVTATFTAGGTAPTGGAVQLPRTGQTKCFDSAGTEVACAGTGQDGDLKAGALWPSPRFTPGAGAETDCITDNLTGLMWPKNGNLPNEKKNWNDAIDYANNLVLCGYDDWRLPNVNELQSLLNLSKSDSAEWLNTQGFTNVQPNLYWSSNTRAEFTDQATYVNMQFGYTGWYGKTVSPYVWPVRAGQSGSSGPSTVWQTGQTASYRSGDDGDLQRGAIWPSPRFTDHNNGEVTDNLTGFAWTKDANAPGPSACGPGTNKTWQEALDYIKCLNSQKFLGRSDWRLPNIKELLTLLDLSRYSPALPEGHPFTGVQSDHIYWSSSSVAYNTGNAWYVIIGSGIINTFGVKSGSNSVWPVRAGQVGDQVTLSLNQGWNFISLPQQPIDPSMSLALKDISPNVRIVWGFDSQNKNWLKFRFDAENPTLTGLEAGKGYWLYLDSPANLAIYGKDVSSNVHLYEGWNLIGYSGQDGKAIGEGLLGINGKWSILWNWSNDQWYGKSATIANLPSPIQPLSVFNRGKAYWIKLKEAMDWTQ